MYERTPADSDTVEREMFGVLVTPRDGGQPFWACDWAWVTVRGQRVQVPLVTLSPEKDALKPLLENWAGQNFVKKAEIRILRVPGPLPKTKKVN